jgi:1-phosphofructokinase
MEKKHFNLKIMSVCAGICLLLNASVYSLPLKRNSNFLLRPNLMTDKIDQDKDTERLAEILHTIAAETYNFLDSIDSKQKLIEALTEIASTIVSQKDKERVAMLLDVFLKSLSGPQKDKIIPLLYEIFSEDSGVVIPNKIVRSTLQGKDFGIFSISILSGLDFYINISGFPSTKKFRQDLGGEGVNVSRALAKWGVKTPVFGFIGTENDLGAIVKGLLQKEGVPIEFFMEVDGQSLLCLFVEESGSKLGHLTSGVKLTESQKNTFWDNIFGNVKKGDTLILTGNLIPDFPGNYYGQIIAESARRGIKTFLSSKHKQFLKPGVEALPQFVFLNLTELADFFNVDSDYLKGNFQAVLKLGKKLVLKGIEAVVVTLGEQGAIMVTKDGAWIATIASKVVVESKIGAGDALLAGIAYKLALTNNLQEALKFGVASGTATVSKPGTDLAELEDVEKLLDLVSLTELPFFNTDAAGVSKHAKEIIGTAN